MFFKKLHAETYLLRFELYGLQRQCKSQRFFVEQGLRGRAGGANDRRRGGLRHHHQGLRLP